MKQSFKFLSLFGMTSVISTEVVDLKELMPDTLLNSKESSMAMTGDVRGCPFNAIGAEYEPQKTGRIDLRNKLVENCKFYTYDTLYGFTLYEGAKAFTGYFNCEKQIEFDLNRKMEGVSSIALDAKSSGTWELIHDKDVAVNFKMNVFSGNFQKRYPTSLVLKETGQKGVKLFLSGKNPHRPEALYLWQMQPGENFYLGVKWNTKANILVPGKNSQFSPLAALLKLWNYESKDTVNSILKQGMTVEELINMHKRAITRKALKELQIMVRGKKSPWSYMIKFSLEK